MKITILYAAALMLGGLASYVLSFINGAKYVDYALGIMMGIISLMIIVNAYMLEQSKEFTDSFRLKISKIKIDNTKQEAHTKYDIIKNAKEFIMRAFEGGKNSAEIETELLNSGLSEQQISAIMQELIIEGKLKIEEQPKEIKKVTRKKKKK